MRPRFHAPGLIVSLAASSSSPDRLSTGDLSELAKGGILLCQCETVHAPSFRIWIKLGWLNKSAADLETLTASNADDLETNARVIRTTPRLLVYCCVSFTGNLSVIGSAMPKLDW